MFTSRRKFLQTVAAAGLGAAAGIGNLKAVRAEANMDEAARWSALEAPAGITDEQMRAIVLPAHFDLDEVKRQVEADPRLVHVRYKQFDEAPIEAASHVGNRDIAEYLLGRGARFKIHCAVMLGMYESTVAFLDASPELVTRPGAHNLPLMYHAAHGGDIRILELLQQRGGGQDYDFALFSAAEMNNAEIANWLLAQGASTEAQNIQDKTPLQVALERENFEVAEILRKAGAVEPVTAQ
jgi:hypothetical protein